MRRCLLSVPFFVSGVCIACSAPQAPISECGEARDFVVAMSDYASSGVASVRVADGSQESRFGVDLGKDPQLSRTRDRIFLLARDQDVVFELDTACGAPIAKTSLHDESARGIQNPQDLALDAKGAMWVPRFNDGTLLVVHGNERHVVPLAAYDDDKNPQPSAVRVVDTPRGERAFVALERLDTDLVSRRPSALLELDTSTREVVGTHALLGRNPFGAMTEHMGALYLAEPGNFDAADETAAGIERFDPRTSTSELLLRETELGGSVTELAFRDTCGVAIVADPVKNVNATRLVAFDLRGTPKLVQAGSTSPLATLGYDLQGLAVHGSTLLVGDRRKSSSGTYTVHTFEISADCKLARRETALSLPQKPVAFRPAQQVSR